MRNSGANYGQSNHNHLDTELLSAYIDGEVTADEASRVERHLQSCSSCIEELESLRWTVNLLREVPPVTVPRAFVVRRADMEAEPARRRFALPNWIFNSLQWATVATAILVVLVFAVDLLGVGQLADAPQAFMQAPAMEAPAMAPAAPEAIQETQVVESEKEAAPETEATAEAEREESAELLSAPEEQPMPAQPEAAQGESDTTQPGAQTLREAPTPQVEGKAVEAVGPEPTPVPQVVARDLPASRAPDWLRLAEIGLTGLLIVLLALTLWARRRRAA